MQVPDIVSVTVDGINVCKYFSVESKNDVFEIPSSAIDIVNETKPKPATTKPTTRKPTTRKPTVMTTTTIRSTTSESVSTHETPESPETQSLIADIFEMFNKPSECGRVQLKNKIILGLDTEAGDWPWHAGIFHINNFQETEYNCGGSLIKENMVLTAAHCMLRGTEEIERQNIIVKLGMYNLDLNSENTQVISVDECIYHNNYDPDVYMNDIGLLKLSHRAKMTDFVSLVCLPNSDFSMANKIGGIVGWGQNEFGVPQKTLKLAVLAYVDYQSCIMNSMNRKSLYAHLLRGSNFCAGNENGESIL